MTSVKDLLIDERPDGGLGRGRFRFSDEYSVFDWGRMPDRIPEKGASLCTTGAFTFELLSAAGVPTHYRGVIPPAATADAPPAPDDGVGVHDRTDAAESAPDPVPLADLDAPPREMAIDLARVPDLPHEGGRYDYDAFHVAAGDAFLVPLEIVFRNVVGVGSSLRRRTEPADVGLDLPRWPDRVVELDEPIVEFSTKFEEGDRYLDREEAAAIAGAADLDDLEAVARRVNRVITDRAAETGFAHQDGKIECLSVDGEIRVADVAGTFDENRFAYRGVQVSKEFLRQHYRESQPEWVEAVGAAKAEARDRGESDWKLYCDRTPDPLPDAVLDAARELYAAGANAYTGRERFDAPSIEAAVERVRDL